MYPIHHRKLLAVNILIWFQNTVKIGRLEFETVTYEFILCFKIIQFNIKHNITIRIFSLCTEY